MAVMVFARNDLAWVEDRARALQNEMWRNRATLWGANCPLNPIAALEPGIALKCLGYSVESVASAGETNADGIRGEVAGAIDHGRKLVVISQRFSVPVQLFTAAHEVGHADLHPSGGVMHRDLPLGSSGVVRNKTEVEANRYASCFLMPKNFVEREFRRRFGCEQFELTDENGFALFGSFDDRRWPKYRSLRQLSQYMAGACSFDGHAFSSLSSVFQVSNLAMAIRLEELDLVRI